MASTRIAALVLFAAPAAAAAQDSTTWRYAHVTYLTSVTAYLDAGRSEGLVPGAVLTVARGTDSVAALRVTDLSSHRAAAEILTGGPLAVGDSARYQARAAETPPLLAQATQEPPRAAARGPRSIRGRIGVRYFWIGSQVAPDMSQPALDLRLDGTRIGGTAFGLHVDVRARWILTPNALGSTTASQSIARAYQAAVTWEPRSVPVRVVVGRQMSPTLATISFLDGMTVEYAGRNVSLGGFAGTEPDAGLAFSTAIRSAGTYLQFHGPRGRGQGWNLTVGAAGSYTAAATNREFLFVQGGYIDQNVALFLAQEVDYYRPWKVEMGEDAISPTSTFATARVTLVPGLTAMAGYDNRRNVRLFSDVVNPEVTFDATFRQGVWGGVSARIARRVLLGLDARTNDGGVAGRSTAYTASLGITGLTAMDLGVRARSTIYQNLQSDGTLHVLAVGGTPVSGLMLELNGGVRSDRNEMEGATRTITWFGANTDLAITRSVYLLVSGTHEQGSLDATDQAYVSLTYRF